MRVAVVVTGAVGVAAMVSIATGEAMMADERSPEKNQKGGR
jgi:hypothetical protein